MTTLSITAAGRAALADQANTGIAAVRLTHLELGDGRRGAGDDDDARAALRSRRVRGAVAGRAAAGGRVAAVLDVAAPGWTGDVTEIGLVGRVGGADALLAYWAAAAGDDAPFASHATTRLVVGVTLDVANAAAQVDVTVTPAVSFGASEAALAALTARVAALEEQAMDVDLAVITLRGPRTAPASIVVAYVGGTVAGFTVASNGLSWTVPAGVWLVEWASTISSYGWTNQSSGGAFGAVDGDGARLKMWPGDGPNIQYAQTVVELAAATSYTADAVVSGGAQGRMTWRRIG